MKSIMIFSLLLNLILFTTPSYSNDVPVMNEDESVMVEDATDEAVYDEDMTEEADDGMVEEDTTDEEVTGEDDALVEDVIEEVTEEKPAV